MKLKALGMALPHISPSVQKRSASALLRENIVLALSLCALGMALPHISPSLQKCSAFALVSENMVMGLAWVCIHLEEVPHDPAACSCAYAYSFLPMCSLCCLFVCTLLA